jgi:hypothetical protein
LSAISAALSLGPFVAEFDAALLAPEDVGRQHHKAVQRVLLGQRADVRVDAEYLLEQHQPRPAASRGQREIGVERRLAGRGQGGPLGAYGAVHDRVS